MELLKTKDTSVEGVNSLMSLYLSIAEQEKELKFKKEGVKAKILNCVGDLQELTTPDCVFKRSVSKIISVPDENKEKFLKECQKVDKTSAIYAIKFDSKFVKEVVGVKPSLKDLISIKESERILIKKK